MILKSIPGFCFVDPTNKETINIRFASVNVSVETRRIRAVWNPELVQDLQAFQNIDAEAELTALLTENLRNDIDQQIIRDINDNQRFYRLYEGDVNPILNRWNQFINRDGTLNFDLIDPIDHTIFGGQNEFTYVTLPNEDGWFTNGTFESLMIKIDMRPFHFILPRHLRNRRRRNDIRNLTGL